MSHPSRPWLDVLDEAFADVPSRILIFATSRDKDLPGMLRCLLPKFTSIILTRYLNNPRYVELDELQQVAGEIAAQQPGSSGRIQIEACPAAAWSAADAMTTRDDLICVTGSFFLAAEIRGLLEEIRPGVPQVARAGC
jgi:dihydrofolate synthase / folylpolyglutamate synthase